MCCVDAKEEKEGIVKIRMVHIKIIQQNVIVIAIAPGVMGHS